MYEKVDKGQKTLRVLQSQVENRIEQWDRLSRELEETTNKISLMYHNCHKAIVENHENILKICGT